MKNSDIKDVISRYWPLYALALLLAALLKFSCRITDSDLLTWILAPTARWAGILGGIPFEYLPHQGYVNHYYRFLIAPSCSGLRFLAITFLMLAFSFLHRVKPVKAGYSWLFFSAAFSYLATVFVNGIRIVLAIYLPIPLEKAGLLGGWLDPGRLHTLIGAATYFSSLCAIYPAASFLCQRFFIRLPESGLPHQAGNAPTTKAAPADGGYGMKLLIPALWYFSAVLLFPLLGRMARNDWEGFGEYAALITGVCTLLMLPALAARLLRRP